MVQLSPRMTTPRFPLFWVGRWSGERLVGGFVLTTRLGVYSSMVWYGGEGRRAKVGGLRDGLKSFGIG